MSIKTKQKSIPFRIAFYSASFLIILGEAFSEGFIAFASFIWLFSSPILIAILLSFSPAFLIELGIIYRAVPDVLKILFVIGPIRNLKRVIALRELQSICDSDAIDPDVLDAFIYYLKHKKFSDKYPPEFMVQNKSYHLLTLIHEFDEKKITALQREMRYKKYAVIVSVIATIGTIVGFCAVTFTSFAESALKVFYGTSVLAWGFPPAIFTLGLVFGILGGLSVGFLFYRAMCESIEDNSIGKCFLYFKIKIQKARSIENRQMRYKQYLKMAALGIALITIIVLSLYVTIAIGFAYVPATEAFLAFLTGSSFSHIPAALTVISQIITWGFVVPLYSCFAVSKSIEAVQMMRHYLLKCPAALNKLWAKIKSNFGNENILQFINPFRATSKIIGSIGTVAMLLMHVISESLIAGRGAAIFTRSGSVVNAEILCITADSASNFLTDMPYIIPAESSDESEEKSDRNIVIDAVIYTIRFPINSLAVIWDACFSYQHSLEGSWLKYFPVTTLNLKAASTSSKNSTPTMLKKLSINNAKAPLTILNKESLLANRIRQYLPFLYKNSKNQTTDEIKLSTLPSQARK